MDYRKEHNGWMTFYEHWWFLGLVLLMFVTTPIFLMLFNLAGLHTHRHVPLGPEDCSGDMEQSDKGSVYWCVLAKPETNQIQFVLLLPVTATVGSGNHCWPDHAYNYCDLQIKSTSHQWKIENLLDWKTGVHTVQLRDVTANTTGTLTLDKGRFWQLDDTGNAKRLETIDPAIQAQIFGQVKTNLTNLAMARAKAGD